MRNKEKRADDITAAACYNALKRPGLSGLVLKKFALVVSYSLDDSLLIWSVGRSAASLENEQDSFLVSYLPLPVSSSEF